MRYWKLVSSRPGMRRERQIGFTFWRGNARYDAMHPPDYTPDPFLGRAPELASKEFSARTSARASTMRAPRINGFFSLQELGEDQTGMDEGGEDGDERRP